MFALGKRVSSSQIHSTRFKEKLLEFCSQLKSINNGQNVYLVHDENMGDIIKEASCSSLDNDAYYLTKAAQIIRKEIAALGDIGFKGSFNSDFDKYCVSKTLIELVYVILNGLSNKEKMEDFTSSSLVTSTIMQLLVYNSVGRRHCKSSNKRHCIKHHFHFKSMSCNTWQGITNEESESIERFVNFLYDRTSSQTNINEARQQMLVKDNKQFKGISPTKAALEQQIKRATSCM